MHITRTILIPPTADGVAIMNTRTVYTSADGLGLCQEYSELVASDTFGGVFRRRSEDNGGTWSEPEPTFVPGETDEGTLREGETAMLLDPSRNILLRFFNWHLYPGGTHTKDVMRLGRICYQISRDGGESFEPGVELIAEGFSSERWGPDTEYGVNSSMISFCHPFIDRKGRIILPTIWCPPPDRAHPGSYRVLPLEGYCFVGNWSSNGKIQWQASDRISIDPALSSRGLCEPAIAEISGGRFLAILRGSNVFLEGVPGRKWLSISNDSVATWSPVRPLTFDDGEPVCSPATGSQLIRHSRSGKLYWIGNIVSGLTDGNGPRHPLSIARVDEETLSLVRASVTTIDDRQPGEVEALQLSNFRSYEDRATGEFVLTMARLFEKTPNDPTSPAYEYRIAGVK